MSPYQLAIVAGVVLPAKKGAFLYATYMYTFIRSKG